MLAEAQTSHLPPKPLSALWRDRSDALTSEEILHSYRLLGPEISAEVGQLPFLRKEEVWRHAVGSYVACATPAQLVDRVDHGYRDAP